MDRTRQWNAPGDGLMSRAAPDPGKLRIDPNPGPGGVLVDIFWRFQPFSARWLRADSRSAPEFIGTNTNL